MSYPASSSAYPRRRTFTFTKCLVVAAVMAAGVGSMPTTAKAAGELPKPAQLSIGIDSKTTPAPTIQLADEIIRRLRRLGINFNRARVPRPYDPEGEIC